MIVLTIVFGTLYGNTDRTFPVYILTGRLLYSFFSQSTKAALKSIRQNSAMIKKVYVPKYLYPLSSVLFNYVIFLISLIVLAMVSVILGVKPTLYLLQAPIALILILIMSYGCGMILATIRCIFQARWCAHRCGAAGPPANRSRPPPHRARYPTGAYGRARHRPQSHTRRPAPRACPRSSSPAPKITHT